MKLLTYFAIFLPLAGQVTGDRILQSSREPGNWLTYSGNYAGHRHSPLASIDRSNVARLKPVWSYQVNSLQKLEATPLVVDGIMYLSEPPSNVTALDTLTGRPLWRYRRTYPDDIRVCCGQVNRGVAILDDLVFVGTVDAHVVALDAKTGAVRWDVPAADYREGYSITVAPLAVKDKIVVGMAGGEYGVRGFLDAYDARTGKRAWRFWTVPGPGEKGSETWQGDTWKRGSATTWVTGSYDPETNLVYWGTGNPGPDWNGEVRSGNNLYSDSLLALDADTGQLKWHFQFTPHDDHDWDSTQVPVLVEGQVRGEKRKLVLLPNRNGFFYVLDRVSGQFLTGKPFVKQTWASGLDDSGRPLLVPGVSPSFAGVAVWPAVSGGNNWYSPAYNPQTDLLYIAAREAGSVYFTGDAEYLKGEQFNGGGFRSVPGEQEWGAVRALRPATGDVAWEYKLFSPPWSGLLSTAGGLVFGGTNEGQVFALDAATGAPLWKHQTGGQARSNPISFERGGRQYIAMAMGNSLYVFGLE
ncbi:MAG TPA: PQQ-dependent dehydrogenase, methanol/ethanol family [Bryobacteraceae bacterium]|nr:PQQ-dependent dehydrogenase, methanol/ethanol family [Bryobacteraceae bacterium]